MWHTSSWAGHTAAHDTNTAGMSSGDTLPGKLKTKSLTTSAMSWLLRGEARSCPYTPVDLS